MNQSCHGPASPAAAGPGIWRAALRGFSDLGRADGSLGDGAARWVGLTGSARAK